MEPDPSARLRATRAALQRRFEAREHDLGEQGGREHGEYGHGEYEHGIARWLVSQLPGSDPRQLGWGILAVAAMLYPAPPGAAARTSRPESVRSGACWKTVKSSGSW